MGGCIGNSEQHACEQGQFPAASSRVSARDGAAQISDAIMYISRCACEVDVGCFQHPLRTGRGNAIGWTLGQCCDAARIARASAGGGWTSRMQWRRRLQREALENDGSKSLAMASGAQWQRRWILGVGHVLSRAIYAHWASRWQKIARTSRAGRAGLQSEGDNP